jgi:hypothetical protein
MLELNGHKYSRESFDDYKYRAKFQFEVKGQEHYSSIDIYTTDTSRIEVYAVVFARITDKVERIKLIHWASREQDNLSTKFIEETLKNI